MSHIIIAMVAMTGRVTMSGISRWAGKGDSYRTIQRFFAPPMSWRFFLQHLYKPEAEYILTGADCAATKFGKHTYGLDRFFSGLAGKPVKLLYL